MRLAAVAVTVPAPESTARFLAETLDFAVAGSGDRVHLTAQGEYGGAAPRRMLTLLRGPSLAVSGLTFEHSDPAALRERLAKKAVAVRDLPADAENDAAIGFTDPEGLAVACAAGSPRLGQPLPPSDVRPRRLGHVNLAVKDAPTEAAFYADVLGLRLSEQIGEQFFFLRVGSEHHNLGFRGNAPRATVHHIAFEIAGWETFRTICDRVADRGHVVEYGPGRHGPGHNLFVYLVEPTSGLRLELYADMARIEDEAGYRPKRWDSADRVKTVNRWGPQPPDSFLK